MVNAAGFGASTPWIMSATDYVTLWEAPYVDPTGQGKASYRDRYVAFYSDLLSRPPPSWWNSYGSRFTHVVFNSLSPSDADDVVCKSRSRGSPSLYVHNATTATYGYLSPHFERTVADLNPPACPNRFHAGINNLMCAALTCAGSGSGVQLLKHVRILEATTAASELLWSVATGAFRRTQNSPQHSRGIRAAHETRAIS